MWGPGIIGFGSYHYKYESGREGDIFLTGFSPRKQSMSLYIMTDSMDAKTCCLNSESIARARRASTLTS